MSSHLSIKAVGHATSLLFGITYTLCIIFDLAFPQYAMYSAWQIFLPGFNWISWSSYFIGLLETYLYGWYFALIWTVLINVYNKSSFTPSKTNYPEAS